MSARWQVGGDREWLTQDQLAVRLDISVRSLERTPKRRHGASFFEGGGKKNLLPLARCRSLAGGEELLLYS